MVSLGILGLHLNRLKAGEFNMSVRITFESFDTKTTDFDGPIEGAYDCLCQNKDDNVVRDLVCRVVRAFEQQLWDPDADPVLIKVAMLEKLGLLPDKVDMLHRDVAIAFADSVA